MYIVTNREVIDSKTGLEQFGKRVNAKGPNELRLAEVTRRGRGWQVEFLEDELPKKLARELIQRHELSLNPAEKHFASLKVACDLADKARSRKRHILFFVHGYNNDMEDVVEQAYALQERYRVIVVPFSWPANGGGVSGTASYKSDKRDARASTGAMERAMQKVHGYLKGLTEARRQALWREAGERHPNNNPAREALYAKLLDRDCPFTVNAMFHSMGNYLLKHMLKSSIADGTGLIFDNVLLVAADTNNLDHSLWVERIKFRKRLFVTINEDDYALAASRAKAGSEQLARLGHFLRNLTANNAHYVNFTDAPWVRKSHSYFNDPAKDNEQVREFFARALTGDTAEDSLRFHAEGNWYGFR